MKNRGFTLVELSIVLVIIGLLIGSILSAQSMIATGKINATAQQIGQLDAMVMSFKDKYNYLPGDAPSFGGDGDNIIEGWTPSLDHVTVYARENANFWNNIEPETYVNTASLAGTLLVTEGTGKNAPAAKIAPNSGFIAATTTDGSYASATSINCYSIIKTKRIEFNSSHYRILAAGPQTTSPVMLLSIDKKIDNGLADSGHVLSGSIPNAWNGYGGVSTTASTNCSSGSNYTSTNTTDECVPVIRIGGIAGNLQ